MKKKFIKFMTISIALVFSALSVVFSTGCGLVVRSYARENARVIATISEFVQNAYVSRSAIRRGNDYVFIEFSDFDANNRAIKARQINSFGDPIYPEVVFDVFTGQHITLMNHPSLPRWTSAIEQRDNRDHVFAFERDANGAMLGTDLGIERLNATIRTVRQPVEFRSPEIRIYQAQLVNHFNQFAGQFINQGMSVEETVEQLIGILINQELVMIEADKEFFVGNLYWTEADVEEIQRAVYHTIDMQILRHMNQILERRGSPHLLTPEDAAPDGASPQFPTRPEPEMQNPPPSPRIHANREAGGGIYRRTHDNGTDIVRQDNYRWHDEWYLNDAWFLHGEWNPNFANIDGRIVGAFEPHPSYIALFPGMHGSAERRSLAREAVNAFLEEMLDNAQHIIGLSDYNQRMDDTQRANRAILEQEAEFFRFVRDTRGIEFVYPLMGNSLTFKLLIGTSSIQQAKLEKLQLMVTNSVQVSQDDLAREHLNRLQSQRTRFGGTNNIPVNRHEFSAAMSAGELMLWTPSNRYLWVKHILLPFGAADEARLERWDERNAHLIPSVRAEQRALYRERIAEEMNVYRNVDGNRDFSRAYSSEFVVNLIYDNMRQFRNVPHLANEAFHDLIFDWNNDPGIFNNRTGYQVIYRLEAEDTEQFMQEFADAAREFRTRQFGLGQLLTDETGAPQLAITDFGIHIMFYAADPFYFAANGQRMHGATTLYLNCYTSPTRDERVGDIIRGQMLEQRRSAFYANWEADYIVRMRRRRIDGEYLLLIEQRIVDELSQRWHEEIFGR